MKLLALLSLMIFCLFSTSAHNGSIRMSSRVGEMPTLEVAQDGTLILRLSQFHESRFSSTTELTHFVALQPNGEIKWTFSSQLIGEDLVMQGQMLTTESLMLISLKKRHGHTRPIDTDHPDVSDKDREFHLVALNMSTGEMIWQLTFDSLIPLIPVLDEHRQQFYVQVVRDSKDGHGNHHGDIQDYGHNGILIAINYGGEVVWEKNLEVLTTGLFQGLEIEP